MLTSVALLAVLSLTPAQGGLSLTGARVTYGELGAPRPDLKYLPGDKFFVAFDIEGITVDDTGRVKYSMGMDVINKDGTPIFVQQPQEREDFLPLGGSKLPGRAFVTIGFDQVPGAYTCKVTVTDRASKSTKTLEQKFEVIAKDFGLVQVLTSADNKGEIPLPPLGVAGQSIFVHFGVVGFTREAKLKQPDVIVEMAVLTKDGKPALAKPDSININSEVDAGDLGIPFRFFLPLNRPGEFTIELKATDKLTKAVSKVQLPIKVLPPPN